MTTEDMYNALIAGTVTLEEFQDWVSERQSEYQSFCAYEQSMYNGE